MIIKYVNSSLRRNNIRKYNLFLLLIPALLIVLGQFSYADKEDHLFTDDEAKVLRYSEHEWKKEVLPTNPPDTIDHPTILFDKPAVEQKDNGPTITATDPSNVYIVIEQNNSALDPGTLKVWGEKFFVHVDVTDRVLKYFRTNKEGAYIKADSIHIPHGHYKVGISIADVNGNKTEKKYRLVVE